MDGAIRPSQPLWPTLIANFIRLLGPDDVGRAVCLAPSPALLVEGLREWSSQITPIQSSQASQLRPHSDGPFDAVVVLAEDHVPPLAPLAQAAASEAVLYLLTPQRLAHRAAIEIRNGGWRVSARYLVKPGIGYPHTIVPDSVQSVLAFLDQEPPRRALPRSLLRALLMTRWRPAFFGGRIFVARRSL